MGVDSEEKSANIKKRISQILETRHDTEKETIDALRALSTFCTVNSSLARRNLQNQIEKRNLETYENFVKAFGDVKEHLDSLYEDVLKMNSAIDNMASRLQESKEKTHHLIVQTTSLQDEKKKVEKQLYIANAFISHFQLTPMENATLHGVTRDTPITEDFFSVLEKVDNLHNQCKSLIHSGFETAALDIMEKISLHQEAAIERLYRWTQHGCRNFDSSDNKSLIPRAMCKLQTRPVLFKYVVDEYCGARKSCLVRSFIDALTKGGSGAGKPIEYYAHDPKRYIGDILAWVHQSLPIEKESLTILFKHCDKINLKEEVFNALVEITEALCHPLKVRMELILTSDKQAVLLCIVTNLIRYYSKILSEEIHGGLLLMTLGELQMQSEAVFLGAVERKVKIDLSHGVKAPPTDLTPSNVVTDLLSFLREILSITSVSEHNDRSDLLKAVALLIDPLLRAINETACHLSTTDMAVYLLNCIYQIQCTISLCPFTNDYNERLQAQSDAQMDTLTSEQASSLVANLNLGPIYTILQEQEHAPLSSIPGMESTMLKSFMNKFDSFIAMPEVFLLPQISLLMSSTNKSTVQRRAFEVILAIYKNLYSAVHDPANKYENPEAIVRRTPAEVAELLAL